MSLNVIASGPCSFQNFHSRGKPNSTISHGAHLRASNLPIRVQREMKLICTFDINELSFALKVDS